MIPAFSAVCHNLKRLHARRCFAQAVRYNRLAHDDAVRGKRACFAMKARCIEAAIRLAPEAVYVDDFQLAGGGIVGITFPEIGRLHVKLAGLSEYGQQFVWTQIKKQCSAA